MSPVATHLSCWSGQVHSMIEKLAQATDIRAALVVGGLSMQVQASTLKTSPEIVVATPVSPLLYTAFWPLLGLVVFVSPSLQRGGSTACDHA